MPEFSQVMKLKNDKKLRDRFFVPDAMSHPAKGHLGRVVGLAILLYTCDNCKSSWV